MVNLGAAPRVVAEQPRELKKVDSVLELIGDTPLLEIRKIAQAIARCRHRECAEVDRIGAEACRLREAAPAVADDLSRCSDQVRRTASARPSLSHFDRLLNRGDPGHG